MYARKSLLLLLVLLAALDPIAWSQAPSEPIVPLEIVNVNYPPLMRRSEAGGHIQLKLNLAPDGAVQAVETSASFPFKQPAMEAISKWRFPKCDSPEHCTITLSIVFSIEGACNSTSVNECPPAKTTFVPPATVRVTATSIRAIVN